MPEARHKTVGSALLWIEECITCCVKNLLWACWNVSRNQKSRFKLEPWLSKKYHIVIQRVKFLEIYSLFAVLMMMHLVRLSYEFWSSVILVLGLFSYKVTGSLDVSSVCGLNFKEEFRTGIFFSFLSVESVNLEVLFLASASLSSLKDFSERCA